MADQNPPANPPAPDFGAQIKMLTDGFAQFQQALPQIVDARIQAALPKPKPEPKPEPKPDDSKTGEQPTLKSLQEQVTALTGEVKKRDEALAAANRHSAIRAAVSKIEFFDPEDAVRELAGQVQEKDGRHFVPGTEIVAGVQVAREFTMEEAVQALAKRKPHWVKARVAGGSGATGASGTLPAGVRTVTRADLAAGKVKPQDLIEGKVVVAD